MMSWKFWFHPLRSDWATWPRFKGLFLQPAADLSAIVNTGGTSTQHLQTAPKAYTISSGDKGGTSALAVFQTRELLC
jgi:hypothetical protein